MFPARSSVVVILLVVATSAKCDFVHPAPAVAPAIGYARAVPYNVPPYAASVNIFNRLLAPAPVFPPPLLHSAPYVPPILPNLAPLLPPLYSQAHSIHPPSLPRALPIPLPQPAIPFAGPGYPLPPPAVPAPAFPVPPPIVPGAVPAVPFSGPPFAIPPNILPYSIPGLGSPFFGVPSFNPNAYAQPLWRR